MSQFDPQTTYSNTSEGLFPGFPALDLGKLFHLITKRLWLALSITVVFLAFAFAYISVTPKIYESTALINIESGGSSNALFRGGVKAQSYDSLDELKSIAAGLKSGSVILRVVDQLKLRDDPTFMKQKEGERPSDSAIVGFLGKRLGSELIRGERNIFLSVRDTDPVRAQRIAETILSEFQLMIQEANFAAADRTRQSLLAEREKQAERVDQAESDLQKFREEYPDLPMDETNGALNLRYLDLQAIANRAKDEEDRLKAEFDQYHEVKDDPERILEIGTHSGIESIQKLILARNQKQAEFYKIKQQFTPRHATYQSYEAEVKGLNQELKSAARAIGESIEKRYLSAVERTKSAQEVLRSQAGVNLGAEEIRREFRTLNRARAAALATYDRLLERINDTSVTRNVDETVMRTFSPALVNPTAVHPKKSLVVALAGIFGGGFGLGVVLLLGLLDRTLSTKKQVESTLAVSVLAQIPSAFPGKNCDLGAAILLMKDPQSLVTEGFRALRTSLSSLAPRSVLFTSAVSDEGKSFCAANLAVLQAHLGYRTLLVDADFRNPQMSGVFVSDRSNTHSLSLQNHCQPTPVENLYLISLGRFSTNGSEPLNGEDFASLLWEAYSNFDCLIIDTSPLGMVSEALDYSRYADAVVLVVRADRTQAGPALDAVRDLRKMRAPLAGCVLNGLAKDTVRENYVRRTLKSSRKGPDRQVAPSLP